MNRNNFPAGITTIMVLAALVCAPVFGDVVDLGGGWQATVFDSDVAELIPGTPASDHVPFRVEKEFRDPPGPGGVFPAINILFSQIAEDDSTLTRFVLTDEFVTNLTGVDWLNYNWQVLNEGEVWFDVADSSSWDVSPFANPLMFSDPDGVFGDPNKATFVSADGGVVSNGDSFSPGLASGDLVIQVDLSNPDPLNFTFKQFPAPEPSMFLLIGFGAALLARRR